MAHRPVEWFTARRVFVGGRFHPATWLGVEDGVVAAVTNEAPAGAAVHDFGAAALFPGTVNTHTHAFHSLFRGLGDDLPLLAWLNDVVYFHEMKMTALVQKSLAGRSDAIRAADVLAMATENGAAICEYAVGRLAPGAAADFLVLDLQDLALVPDDRLESHMVYSMSDRAIRHVYVGGRRVVADGRLTGVDEDDLIHRVRATSEAVRRRA